MIDTYKKKIIQARVSLLFQHPFFGQVSLALKLKEANDWCDTMAVDGKFLYYNTEFVESLTPQEMIFLIGHEVLHVVYEHFIRIDNRNKLLFNIAGDYVINDILLKNKVGSMPAQALHDSTYSGMTTEQVYDILFGKFKKALNNNKSKQNNTKSDSSCSGSSSNGKGEESTNTKNNNQNVDSLIEELAELASRVLDEVVDGSSDEEDNQGKPTKEGKPTYSKEQQQQIQDSIKADIINAAKAAGRMPLGLERLVQDLTEPQINWKEELANIVQSTIVSDYTFYKPSKKSDIFVLPGMKREETIKVAAAIDMSGSISQEDAKILLSEISGIMQQYNDYEINVWSYDTATYNHTKITPQDDISSFIPRGGGGTDFNVNYSHMRELDIKPDIFINFTDGYPAGTWGEEDYCTNQIFCILSYNKSTPPVPPFGRAIYISN